MKPRSGLAILTVAAMLCVQSTPGGALPSGRRQLPFVPGDESIDESEILRRMEAETLAGTGPSDRSQARAGVPARSVTLQTRIVFRDGRALEGMWIKASRTITVIETNESERHIPLSRIRRLRFLDRSIAFSRMQGGVGLRYSMPVSAEILTHDGLRVTGRIRPRDWIAMDFQTAGGRLQLPFYTIHSSGGVATGTSAPDPTDMVNSAEIVEIAEIQPTQRGFLPEEDVGPMGSVSAPHETQASERESTVRKEPDARPKAETEHAVQMAGDAKHGWMAVLEEAQRAFRIDRFEMSRAEADFFPASNRHPLTGISFAEARSLCRSMERRLCTTAEWTAACLGLARSSTMRRCNTADAGPAPTGSHPLCQTGEGVFDMIGNVREWTEDPVHGAVAAGGSYASGQADCFDRLYLSSDTRSPDIGVRCCQ